MAKNTIHKTKQAPKGAAGDDRNLVLVDEDFQDADFEDRVWLFWKRHGKQVIFGAVVVFLAVLGAIIYVEGKKIHAQNLQDAYALAKTPEERLAFARAHSKDPMAGTALYTLGNEAAGKNDFSEAALRYGEAAAVFEALSGTEFVVGRDRAKIAEAVSLDRAGKKEEALSALTKLAGSATTDETIRGQAMYNLAVSAVAENNISEARKWLNEMDRALSPRNMWQAEKSGLIRMEPKLAATEQPAEPVEKN